MSEIPAETLQQRPELLICHELIGLRAKVILSSDPGIKGLSGTVVDETRNLLLFDTKKGRKKIPKKGNTFRFRIGKNTVDVEGWTILEKPENRIRKGLRLLKKWRPSKP